MSTAKPKFYVANKHTNRISYRKLSAFEDRNQRMFELTHSKHDTWVAAHAWLIDQSFAKVLTCKKALAIAERSLAKAKAMVKPEAA